MRPLLRFAPSTALFLTALAGPVLAQNPTARDLAERAHNLAKTLDELGGVDKPSATQKQQLAAAEQELAALVKEATESTAWTADHYVQASGPLLQEHAEPALAIALAGTKRFADSRPLWNHVGLARIQAAFDSRPGTAQVESLRAAEQALRKALTLQPETVQTHLGLYQALDHLGDVDGAAKELDTAMQDTSAKAEFPALWLHRASLLLRANKPKEAFAELAVADGKAEGMPLAPAILRVRARALAKDAAATDAAITALLEQENSPRTQLEAADALFYLGRKADAAKVLAKLPPIGKFESEEERKGQLCAQSGQALAAYWAAGDVSAKGGLRAALTKALGHHFLVMDPTAKPKPKESDLSSSPRAMANLVPQAMKAGDDEAGIKNWANLPLLALCIQASVDYKPQGFEATLLGQIDKNPMKVDDVPALLLAARHAIGDPDASCALSGLHAMERIAPPAKKPPAK